MWNFYMTYCPTYQHNWESNNWFQCSQGADKWQTECKMPCGIMQTSYNVGLCKPATSSIMTHLTSNFILLYFMQQYLYFIVSEVHFLRPLACSMSSEISSRASRLLCFLKWICLPYMTIWGHFFVDINVAVHKHINLGCVGFISDIAYSCVYTCEKYQFCCVYGHTHLGLVQCMLW